MPLIWSVEVVNALLVGERTGRLTAERNREFFALLRTLYVIVDMTDMARIFSVVLELARAQGLSGYDASYLELARRDGVPLATADKAMRAAATRIGVPLIEIPQPEQPE